MTTADLSIVCGHEPRLCYAMQQSAVPWLRALRLINAGTQALTELELTIALQPGFVAPHSLRVTAVPAGATVAVPVPDLALSGAVLANTIERTRADLVVEVHAGGELLAVHRSPIDVLAYNEWPGLATMPALLAAFVSPNHPGVAPLVAEVAAELQQRTGDGTLDGYQRGDTERVRAMLAAVFDVLERRVITYVTPPPSFERDGQKVRTPEQVLGERLGTCLDLALLVAAVCEHIGLAPLLAITGGHAFAGVWLQAGSTPEAAVGSAVELRKRCDLGVLTFVECTSLCASMGRRFDGAVELARQRLADDADFVVAIDVAAARRLGIRPLPPRTGSYLTVDAPPRAVLPAVAVAAVGEQLAPPKPSTLAVPPPPEPPKDRLEHWKGKLLDLTLWNRLLNSVATKKTIPLLAPDLGALEDRLQSGARFRVHARPELGEAGKDPRDLDLAAQREGVDLRARYLADELRAGRLRADLTADELAPRLVEIFRHARTSLEESGANTLHLALGFLHWYETPQSDKVRRAPLLLVPLSIERLSVQEGFRFVLDDGEPRVNQSLIAMLARDHGFAVPLGEAPPEDEHGIDVAAVFDAFRRATLAMPRWEVQPTACIGFFSFAKYLMWLDLAARDELLRSPVLRHLVERPGAMFAQDVPEVPRDELDDVDPAGVFCPKDADSSQLAAVLAGAAGRTFVLEGPPGTGKSQTITNLIAQALANGKRVLFVAEKRAALEVVQRRLDDVGLGAFCLELHSSKSGPKAVLTQLGRALEHGARQSPAQWARLAADLQQRREQLNTFVRALHRRREHGWSVFAAMGQLIGLREAARIELPELRAATPTALLAARASVEQLAAAGAALAVPDAEPWWGVRLGEWTPALAREVVPLAERLAAAADAMAVASAAVAESCGLAPAFGQGPSAAQLELLLQLGERLRAPSLPPPSLLRADWRTLAPVLGSAIDAGMRRERIWLQLADRWRPELLTLDLDRLAGTWRTASASFWLLRWWRLRAPRRELAAVANRGAVAGAAAVTADLERALQVRHEDRALQTETAVAAALGAHWRDGRADWAAVAGFRDWLEHVRTILVRIVPGALQPDAAALAAIADQVEGLRAGAAVLPPRLAALRAAADELAAATRAAAQRLDLDEVLAFGPVDRPAHAQAIAARARRWLAAVPRLRDHCAYARAAAAARVAGAEPVVAAHGNGTLPTDAVVPCFRRTTLEDWLDALHRAEPQLARFRGVDHERAIAGFADLDRRSLRLAAEVVVARLGAALPQVRATNVGSSELGTLERELKKQRRHKPVRRLLAEIPDLFARLAPCVLMSPLSVAQFLGRAGTRFDLVVFDEASQIPMWDAASAIGRGTSLVVVGDSRQLPPTTFFQRLAQGDEPAPDDLPEDLESVLDECAAAGLPRQHLDWHYRSRHESLIAFSNHHYYHNRLLTFPAPAPAAGGLGVRAVVVDGVYDRAGSQTNRREAELLVADLVARLREPERPRHSVGIVTFSRAQQVLIEDLLDRERALHAEVEAACADATEPLFVKNLENVQGDERDAIYFSICYGPDAAGKVHENYGPLNAQGGERRLNVAVTRARRELVVFTSLRPEQIANRSAALGARHLRTFLDYALRGQAALAAAVAVDPSGPVESPFEAAVRDALVRRGHEVHTQIGCSGYRIDLAVVDPRAPGSYLIGIECDGAAYHSAATARDRDRLRAGVLQGLGWRLCRVWSTDFWQDPAGELDKLEAAIAAAVAAPAAPVPAPEPPPATSAAPVPANSPPPADPDGPRPYVAATLSGAVAGADLTAAAATPVLRDQLRELLVAEAPITFGLLSRRVADAWGVARVTERVRERLRELLPAGAAAVDDVLWGAGTDAAAFRGFRVPSAAEPAPRAAEDLPIVEIGNAMRWLLRQHAALADDDLAREAARCFGITRLGSVVRDVMARALEHALVTGRARRDGAVVRLP